MESYVTGLRCAGCGHGLPVQYALSCPRCGGLLELEYDLERMAGLPRDRLSGPGIWRYAFALPVRDPAHRVSLGEGNTPLYDCPRLAEAIGVRKLWLKFEGTNPTGTVKDRTSATAVSAAREFGYKAIGVVSTGNAGSSLATYGTRAGLRTFIFCYERGSQPKLNHMAACASDLVFYRGVYDDMIGVFDRLVDEGLVFDGGASRNPFKHEGKKTIAYEVAEQLGWAVPDFFVAPVGVGETFIASYRGFRELAAMGWTAGVPRMVAAQSAVANPIVRAWREGGDLVPQRIGYTVAEGVAVGNPDAKGRYVLDILRREGGLAGDAADADIVAAQKLVARTEGIWAGPTGVVTVAVLRNLVRAGQVPSAARVVCMVTETGLKGEYPPIHPEGIVPDYEAVKKLVMARLGGFPA
ncbi:threonine synthase [Caldinitratiruptor microaerophilus]|uniref:Threonine synthase n=1 Tax=Caldinitratiruptor microaerophilus TaxID=671077 RepID=A0AA35G774_9FIRM|nr:threonine synthase [Caldinitratiruptor microaerophilus]BDG62371.1 threonine synthase [Caldinitratiruptor microaerophilus]